MKKSDSPMTSAEKVRAFFIHMIYNCTGKYFSSIVNLTVDSILYIFTLRCGYVFCKLL